MNPKKISITSRINPGTHFHPDTIQCISLILLALIRVIRGLTHNPGLFLFVLIRDIRMQMQHLILFVGFAV